MLATGYASLGYLLVFISTLYKAKTLSRTTVILSQHTRDQALPSKPAMPQLSAIVVTAQRSAQWEAPNISKMLW